MCIKLPKELWVQILSLVANNQSDRPELWVSGRAVSTTFKEAVETIYSEKLLPKTSIRYHLGTRKLDDNADSGDEDTPTLVALAPGFEFSHLSADKSTAFFIDAQVNERYKHLVTSGLRSVIEMNQYEKPSHTVQVRRELNDTPIPGLSIDYDTMTLSCNWRGLFSSFFGEELLVSRIHGRAMHSFDARRSALIAEVHAGRMDIVSAMQQVLTVYGDENSRARKLARRMRIRRQYEQDGFDGWTPLEGEEVKINQVLKERMLCASALNFSDEEDDVNDEDCEDDDEEGDDDEWQDEEDGEDGGGEEDEEDEEEEKEIEDTITS